MKVNIEAKEIGQIVNAEEVFFKGPAMELHKPCAATRAGLDVESRTPSSPQDQPVILQSRYHILEELGHGGFGKTFLARDTGLPSGRLCVVKQLNFFSEDPQIQRAIQDKFYIEAKVLERLAECSDQIPKLYAYFVEDGLFYLVQQWVEGETLTSRVKRSGVIAEAEVSKLLTDILLVLDYVHSRQVIHRDIKPDNVMLRRSDGRPVLIDFGAVKEVATVVGATSTSVVIGTPGFMSPEQANGKAVYASDIYSLGWTVFYLLTAKQPQQVATSLGTIDSLCGTELSCLTPGFAAILLRMMRSQLTDRYSDAKEILRDLQRLEISASTNSTVLLTLV